MESNSRRPPKIFLIVLLVLVPALFLIGWSQASLNLSFIRPSNPPQTIFIWTLSAFIFLAFVIFALILIRILLKLYVERRQAQLGSRFKTKMVVAFLGLSLVPVCFLFAFAYGLLNRSIDKWFGIPFDIVRKDASQIVRELEGQAEQRVLRETGRLVASQQLTQKLAEGEGAALQLILSRQTEDLALDSVLCFDSRGHLLGRAGGSWPTALELPSLFPELRSARIPVGGLTARSASAQSEFFLAARPIEIANGKRLGTIVGVTHLSPNIYQLAEETQREAQHYDQLSRERKAVKRAYLSMLCLLTLLILFVATWSALFLSKQVTVPIQALAEATHEVSKGNLGFQVSARADDELGILIQSFNEMTRQLQESRGVIERAARELQRANRELEERGNTMEALLQNIPTGVISLDPQGQITQVNSIAERMFGHRDLKAARKLSDLFSIEDQEEIAHLIRRATRQGVVTCETELELGQRRAFVALTISSIRVHHRAVGTVIVLEDLTELLRAQKAAAWREVAQRLAHEIKNPLTPIQLSTERIRRLIERASPTPGSADLAGAVAESASLIEREVASLKSLVDEFSTFARFPASQPVPSSLNAIVENAMNVFDGRLDGIEIHHELAPDLPPVQADPEQMKRALVNLIDNAAEALAHSLPKEIWLRTSHDADRDVVELLVADSGPGIPAEAKEKLFLPFFSTKRRGTGLGLAIVSRIVSEHNGSIRVEENRPAGAKFIIELPAGRGVVQNAVG